MDTPTSNESELIAAPKPDALIAYDTVNHLIRSCDAVLPDASANSVWERFTNDSALNVVPVVDENNVPVGLLDRRSIIEAYSKPYAHDLFRHKTAVSLLPPKHAIVVEHSISIDELAEKIAGMGSDHIADGYIVTEQGKYIGVGTGQELFNEVVTRKQSHLFHMAHYDDLTGLPNRNFFLEKLRTICRNLKQHSCQVAVLFVDLDRFKYINDTLGHSAGDRLLSMVADRLKDEVRAPDIVARLGGDEFTVILNHIDDLHSAVSVIERLLKRLREPFFLQERAFSITASIGVAVTADPQQDIDDLIRKADTAMFYAKDQGKNTFKFYHDGLSAKSSSLLKLEHGLRMALKKNEFNLVYQPVIDVVEQRVCSVETLLRWYNPELGHISPGKFIPLAEALGIIHEIGSWVLYQACQQLQIWRNQGVDLTIAVNVSGRQVDGDRFAAQIAELLKATGVHPESLKLEVTESFILERPNAAISGLRQIRDMGVRISLDDFGTGYSSMSYLKRLPIDELKIDRSFIHEINDSPQDEAIVKAITEMSHSMGIKVVAEGVETGEHVTKLCDLGCDRLQGYYFARPLAADAIPEFIADKLWDKC